MDDTKVKVRNGYICHGCFERMPKCIQMNIEKFTIRQIFQLGKIIGPASSKAWAECGMLGVAKDSISINGTEIKLRDIKKIRINFHPKGEGQHPNTAFGIITAVIETKSPHFVLEEPFYQKDIVVGYSISGKKVTYHYSYAIEKLFAMLQECIDNKTYDMTAFMEKYQMATQKVDAEKRKREAEKRRKEEEQRKKAEKEENARKRAREKKDSYKGRTLSKFEEAKVLFEVELPYTKDQIKKKRNELIKQHHPDIGGSDEMCKKINEAYTLLLKFAS